jgi:translation initiation factor 4G
MHICKLKPPTLLPTLGVLGIEPVDQASFARAHDGSGRHRNASGAMPVSANRQASVGLGIGGFQKPSVPSGFQMGNFRSPGSKLTSEERFAMFNPLPASTSSATSQFRSPMVRPPSNRIRSKRGEKRGDINKTPMSQQEHGYDAAPILGAGSEPVVPLEISTNRWVPTSTTRKVQPDVDSPELVGRKVKALLNKLTMEKFETISDQIIHWANKSVNEEDGETIIQVIRLIFEHATDEPAWSEMYARLCRKIMDHIIAGNLLFHKYLLNRCQEDFERGCQWFAKEAAVATAATCVKSSDNQAIKTAHAKKGTEEAELYLGEYYNTTQEGTRQYLGLIKFISELFKLHMLNGCIMHECVRKLLGNVENLVEEKLLGNVENLVEEKIESLCQLLKTVGQLLDTPKARAHMTVYFTRMNMLYKSHNFSARMQFMLQVCGAC